MASKYTEKKTTSRIVGLTLDPGIDKKIKEHLAEGQPCVKKPTTRKQQSQIDHGNFPTAIDTKTPAINRQRSPQKGLEKKT